jgi:hypothetical protein
MIYTIHIRDIERHFEINIYAHFLSCALAHCPFLLNGVSPQILEAPKGPSEAQEASERG